MSCGRNRKQTTLPIIRRNRINKLLSFGNLGMYYVRKRTNKCLSFIIISGGLRSKGEVHYDHWRGGEKKGGRVQSAGRDAGIIGRWNWRIPTSATLWPSPSESFSKLNIHTHTDNCFFVFSFLFFRVLFSVVFYLHFSFDWMGFAWPLHLGRFVV